MFISRFLAGYLSDCPEPDSYRKRDEKKIERRKGGKGKERFWRNKLEKARSQREASRAYFIFLMLDLAAGS